MRSARRGGRKPTKLFFAADLHGSEPAYRKFLRAADFHHADALVFGGDLMGKAFVPIVRVDGSYRAHFLGEVHTFDADGLQPFTGSVARTGYYWKVMERDEYVAAFDDPIARSGLFEEAATARLEAWLALAEERLAGTGVRLYMTGGNDDEPSVLEALDRHRGEHVVHAEGRLVELDEEHTMITVGWSTETPWDTPREASEEEIGAKIEAEVAKVPDLSRCVFNFHCPPKDTPIDTCVKLEKATGLAPDELPRPVRISGQIQYTGGGSAAVRSSVERYQPVVALHGHIHESRGRFRFRRTQCFNPGSEYGQGILQAWMVALRAGKLTAYQHTSG